MKKKSSTLKTFLRRDKKKSIAAFFLLILPSLIIILIHMSFVFAKNAKRNEMFSKSLKTETHLVNDSSATEDKVVDLTTASAYNRMNLEEMGLSRNIFDYAIKGFNYLVQQGKLANNSIISIVDFSQPSSKKRLFVIDLENSKVIFNTYVAHGVKSGGASANQFSNAPESNKSSLGFYETSNTYMGGNGYSLRLDGLEPGINDNANRRAIVMHGAAYVNESLAKSQGYIGRSWGCPAVPEKLHKPIINKIKNGTCLFIYSPNENYLSHSRILHPDA